MRQPVKLTVIAVAVLFGSWCGWLLPLSFAMILGGEPLFWTTAMAAVATLLSAFSGHGRHHFPHAARGFLIGFAIGAFAAAFAAAYSA